MTGAAEDRHHWLGALEPGERARVIASMSLRQQRSLRHHWDLFAHPGQRAPEGDWSVWLIMAGRGFGKTRAGAEWVRSIAETDGCARFALVAASLGEARSVMVEGDSGILATSRPGHRPRFEPSKHRLRWPTGAEATIYTAAEPEALRGPQHSHACGPGAEGTLRQRSARADRHASPPLRRGRSGQPAHRPADRRDVDRGR